MIAATERDKPESIATCGDERHPERDVSEWISLRARERPEQPAVITLGEANGSEAASITFAQLDRRVQTYAEHMRAEGLAAGMRVLVMVPPGEDFVALTFAMFRAGVTPVMIDPGMGVSRMLECVRQVDAQGFIGVPLAHVVRVLRPSAFRRVKHLLTVGRRWFWGGGSLREWRMSNSEYRIGTDAATVMRPEQPYPAAILFTSGSTGPAKGVVYEHSMFDAQVRMIQDCYGIEPGEIDVPTFPLFALFSVAMGMTAVIPRMDASRPARADPAQIVAAINGFGATNSFGSPALWRRVAAYCTQRGIKLPTLRRILIAGAPVPWDTISQLHQALAPGADVYTPYGATESLPVSSIGGREVVSQGGDSSGTAMRTRLGHGTCVGRPVAGTQVRIIPIRDEPIENWSDDLGLPRGEIGEIVVSGKAVTKEYFGLPSATASAKIRQGAMTWHRVGDVGYLEESGRIWFCGRKAHRVETAAGTMFTECCEPVFNEHPRVSRCALVGVGPRGAQQPVIVVEPSAGHIPRGKAAFREQLRKLAQANGRTASIRHFLFRRTLPVDVRHNAKINRELLAAWAAKRIPNVE